MSAIGTALGTRLDTRSEVHRANLAAMQALWDEVAAELAKVPTIGGQRYVDRHRRRERCWCGTGSRRWSTPTRRSSS